ncbi:hypothetical protein HJFPF1_04270 [Paramyrothecium foliicola]|nr:hypothetical protein HJFPF1_04270 [Paramyrothecium foliicola]
MKYTAVLISLVTAALAADTRVTLWEHANYSTEGGAWKEFITPPATCRNLLGADAFWNDRTSYIQILTYQKCQFWVDKDCTGGAWVITTGSGGWNGVVPAAYNDRITSFAWVVRPETGFEIGTDGRGVDLKSTSSPPS